MPDHRHVLFPTGAYTTRRQLMRLNKPAMTSADLNTDDRPILFEIFVQDRFSELEVSAVVSTLKMANQILGTERFQWSFISETPGLLEGLGGLMVRAEPAVFDHKLKDFMIVVGGGSITPEAWLPRARAMQRKKSLVAILSNAATAYIKTLRSTDMRVTTHWRDVQILEEWGHYPNLSLRYAETASGIITSAGANYTTELIIHLIRQFISAKQYTEIGSRLMLQSVRDTQSEQPKGASYLMNAFGAQVSTALGIMEENIAEPISTRDISDEVGISVRQLERLFMTSFGISPARYFKKVRLGKAHALVTETNMKLIDIAMATGFNSVASLSTAYRSEYGQSPNKVRSGTTSLERQG